MGSRGSVIPFFLHRRATGVLPLTDTRMTRFSISLQEGVDMVLWAIDDAKGGELFVPKIPSYRITHVAEAIGPECEKPVTGIRPGEKIHEEMITASASDNTVDLGKYFAILPIAGGINARQYCQNNGSHLVEPGLSYNSGENEHFLSIEELRELIREHVDPELAV